VNVADVAVVARVPATGAPPDGVSVSATDEGAREPAKVTATVEANATPVAFAAGVVDATLTVLAVVNVDVNGAMAVPSVLAAATVTVYTVLAANAADGVNVADGAFTASVPGTVVPPGPVTVTDTDEAFSGPEKVTVTGLMTATPDAPDAGVTDATAGTPTLVVNTTSTK
jgi:hypothetical protein